MCCGGSGDKEDEVQDEEPPHGSGNDDTATREERDLHPGGSGIAGGRRKRIRRIHCKTGFDLAIYPNGKIRGTKSPKNKYGLLEFETAGAAGEIRIKGVATGFYVTMTPKGRVVAQPLAENTGTVWVETRIASTTTYMSLLSLDYGHKGYYLAIKKSGKPKAGYKTNHPYPQAAISFLPRIVSEEFY